MRVQFSKSQEHCPSGVQRKPTKGQRNARNKTHRQATSSSPKALVVQNEGQLKPCGWFIPLELRMAFSSNLRGGFVDFPHVLLPSFHF